MVSNWLLYRTTRSRVGTLVCVAVRVLEPHQGLEKEEAVLMSPAFRCVTVTMIPVC